jgi:hypothetical protein
VRAHWARTSRTMINTYTIKLNAEQKHFVIEGLCAVLERTLTGRQRLDLLDLLNKLQALAPDSAAALFVTPLLNRTEEGDILEA